MTTTHTYHYRGYDIVPQRQWASWRVGIYATRANLPLMSQSSCGLWHHEWKRLSPTPNTASTKPWRT